MPQSSLAIGALLGDSVRMRLLSPLLFLAPFAALAAEGPWPENPPPNRYDAMKQESPFVLATVVEAPKPAAESFTANWELTGAGTLQDGRDYVSIRSRDRRIAFTLAGNEVSNDPDAQGVSLASINWAQGWRKSTATLKKGTEFGKVEYSPEAATPQQPPVGNAGQPRTAGMPGVLPGAYPQPGVNQVGVNRGPGVRPGVNPNLVVPNPNGSLPSANIIQPPNQNGAPPTRKLRVINTK